MKLFLILATSLLAVGCAPSKEESRKAFVTKCVDTATQLMPAAGARPIIQRYCDCSADKILAKYSPAELEKFAKDQGPETMEKVSPLIQECMTTMRSELQAYLQAHPEDMPTNPRGE